MREPRDLTSGCVVAGSIVAFLLLLVGIVVPLAGGTDFTGVPRILGTLIIVPVWLLGVVSAVRHREWVWLAALILVSPLAFVLYGNRVSADFTYPEAWSEFDSPPWYLIALVLSPVVPLAYGAYGLFLARRGDGERER